MSIAFVGTTQNVSNVITRSPTAGNLVTIASLTSSGAGTPTITGITTVGGGGVSLTQRTATFETAQGDWISLFDLPNCPAAVTAFTITYNGGTPGTCHAIAVEISGADTSAPYIAGNGGNAQNTPGTGTDAITSGTATTVGTAPALILGLISTPSGNGDAAAGTGYTGNLTGNVNWMVESKRVTSTGTYTATATAATHGGTDRYATFLVAYAESGAGAGGSVLLLSSRLTGGLRELSGHLG